MQTVDLQLWNLFILIYIYIYILHSLEMKHIFRFRVHLQELCRRVLQNPLEGLKSFSRTEEVSGSLMSLSLKGIGAPGEKNKSVCFFFSPQAAESSSRPLVQKFPAGARQAAAAVTHANTWFIVTGLGRCLKQLRAECNVNGKVTLERHLSVHFRLFFFFFSSCWEPHCSARTSRR